MQAPALAKPLLAPLGPGNRALGAGLESLLVCNEFDAAGMVDLVSGAGRAVTGSPSGSPAMTLGQVGRCFNAPSQGVGGTGWNWPSRQISNSPRYTVMSVVRWTGSDGGGFDGFWGVGKSNGVFNFLGSSSGSGNFVYKVNYGSPVTLTGPAKDTTTVHVLFGVTRSRTAHEFWMDGALVATSASNTGTTISSRNLAMIGGATAQNGQGAEHYLDAAWGRDLLPAEIARLTADPWQLVDFGLAVDSWMPGVASAAAAPFPYRPRVWSDFRLRR